jgi:ClpP class serine protease
MEGALLIALAADEIVVDPNAVLGPVAPRVGPYPAVSLLRSAQERGPANVTDEILVLTDQAQKATAQVRALVQELLLARDPEREGAGEVADLLTGIDWTPQYPILLEEARRLGLPINDQLPPEVHALMELYDTTTERRATTSVVRIG